MGAHLREFGSLCLEPHSERSISLGFSLGILEWVNAEWPKKVDVDSLR